MPPPCEITDHRYGKMRVRMMKLIRGRDRHEVREVEVSILLEGDFAGAYVSDDNSKVLPTDTMRNTVYALGRSHPLGTIESFALHLGDHFAKLPQVSLATVDIAAVPWQRAVIGGAGHPHTFVQAGQEREACSATVGRRTRLVESGISDLRIMRTAASGFSGFARDRYTTLKETRDRLLRTAVTATWSYTAAPAQADFATCRERIRNALIAAFADHDSPSVQFTLRVMGERALEVCPEIDQITLALPNLHCLPVDLSPFGMANDNEIFVPVEEPHGVIEATIARA